MKYTVFSKNDAEQIQMMDRFLQNHKNAHFLQSPQWANVKEYWDWRGILITDEETVVGVLSVLIRQLPLRLSLLYAPRGPICNRNDRQILRKMLQAVKQIAKELNGILLYLDPDESDSNEAFRENLKGLGFTEKSDEGFGNLQPQYVFRLDLSGKSATELFQDFLPKTRYNIRISERKGVEIQSFSHSTPGLEAALQSFSQLMEVTGERDHFVVRNKAYFLALMGQMKEHAQLFIAYCNDEPIAGAIEIIYGNKAWYLYGASANCHRDKMPNYLLQWKMICCAIEMGCTIYDFRGVPGDLSKENPLYGLYQFKKGFSGTFTKFSGLFTYPLRPVCCVIFRCIQKTPFCYGIKNALRSKEL